MARAPVREQWLVFIDTNILLDFYRLGGNVAERQLQALEKHKGSLILTNQVWMEFLKNRQKVIMESIKAIKKPDKMSFPPIVANYQQSKMTQKHLDNAIKSHGNVKKRIEAILRDPSHQDPVYRSLKRLFDDSGEFVISRTHGERLKIRSLARKRFTLGYPPRKDSDTSIGDAVNWEWIIHCANQSENNHHVLIVSRDNDYGVTLGDQGFINDWLKREFKDRVSRKRNIVLTQKLTDGLKKLDEIVTREDEEEEARIISTPSAPSFQQTMSSLQQTMSKAEWDELMDLLGFEDLGPKSN